MFYSTTACVAFACRIGVNVGLAEPQTGPSPSPGQSTHSMRGAADPSVAEGAVAIGGRFE